MLVQDCAALRALVAVIGSLVEIHPYASVLAQKEITFMLLLFLEPFLELGYLLLPQVPDEILDPFLVESPIADIPSLLPVLFSLVGDQVLAMQPVEDVPNLVYLRLCLLGNLELRNIFPVLQVLDNPDCIVANNLANNIINLLIGYLGLVMLWLHNSFSYHGFGNNRLYARFRCLFCVFHLIASPDELINALRSP